MPCFRMLTEEMKMYPISKKMFACLVGASLFFAAGSLADYCDIYVEVLVGNTLQETVDGVGTNEDTIVIDHHIPVESNTTIPTNITLYFVSPGKLAVAAGVDLAIDGFVNASPVPYFEGAGNVLINSGQDIYADWFGDDGAAIQKAIDACSGGRIKLLNKQYDFSQTVFGKKGIIIEGVFASQSDLNVNSGTIINYEGPFGGDVFDFQSVTFFGLKNLVIVGNGQADCGLITGHGIRAKYSVVENLLIQGCDVGVDLGNTDDISIRNIVTKNCGTGIIGAHTHVAFYNCHFVSNEIGYQIETASKASLNNCLWQGNGIDIVSNADPHPGGVTNFRDCIFEGSTSTIFSQFAGLNGTTTGMGYMVFDGCLFGTAGSRLFDLTYLSGHMDLIGCVVSDDSSSNMIVDPEDDAEVVLYSSSNIAKVGNLLQVAVEPATNTYSELVVLRADSTDVDETWLYSLQPGVNKNTEDKISIAYGASDKRVGLIKFDLSEFF